ncbi:hypothetical protein LCGC14_1367870 [marine sediment metagenome]|uniref:Uncharacterized protein n=1 Tax=marine sediment metagenome TaxID=412755 RepID=A0A0F9KS76_9ZZZZ
MRKNESAAIFVSFFFPIGLDKRDKVLYTTSIEGHTGYLTIRNGKGATK